MSRQRRLVLRSRRVLAREGIVAADVVVEGDRIAGVEAPSTARRPNEELGDLVLMPGLVDAHVHVNEPGRTEWEGFAHATRAAAAGGVTTIADMPLNSLPVTISAGALAAKRAAAAGQCWVDVGFHAGLVPGNARRPDELRALARDGVLAFKAFLCDSGIPEFPPVASGDLEAAMAVLAEAGVGLLAHAELAVPLGEAGPATGGSAPGSRGAARLIPHAGGDPPGSAHSRSIDRYRDWEASRPPSWECRAIELLISLCRSTGCAVHVVHLAAAEALPAIRRAKDEGLPLTVETCPHYLHFAAEDIPDRDPRYKCAPPIRGRENREALWRALAEGTIDLIASDHSPCPPEWKTRGGGDLAAAWGGIASLQLTLPVVWTGARRRGTELERIAAWLCRRPAELLGLGDDRGSIAAGRLASLVAWDPDRSFVVDAARLHHRHPALTPYAGERLDGVVAKTWVAGREVARAGEIVGKPRGRLVARGRAVSPATAVPEAIPFAALREQPEDALRELLGRCCSARVWVDCMTEAIRGSGTRASGAPADRAGLLLRSDRCFDRLRRDDWLEAFAGHPRIGDFESLRHRFGAAAQLAAGEQAGARDASDRVLRALAQRNADYERRFGHIFIVCATGKSADEMLRLLDQRMANDPGVELAIASGEQRRITRLRIEALIAGAPARGGSQDR